MTNTQSGTATSNITNTQSETATSNITNTQSETISSTMTNTQSGTTTSSVSSSTTPIEQKTDANNEKLPLIAFLGTLGTITFIIVGIAFINWMKVKCKKIEHVEK